MEKTGQNSQYCGGDDGDLQVGVAWPQLRLSDEGDGTILDQRTGLIWLNAANYNDVVGTIGDAIWNQALAFFNALQNGQCELSDGSQPSDWCLPNVRELKTLFADEYYDPSISDTQGMGQWAEGDPFSGISVSLHDFY